MRRFLYFIVTGLGCYFSGCTNQTASNELPYAASVVVSGKGIDLPDGEVYITTFASHAKVIDTANLKDGKFRFDLPTDTEPFRACIAYRDAAGDMQVLHFVDSNYKTSERGLDFFIVEADQTTLKGISRGNSPYVFAEVVDGYENQLIFNYDYNTLVQANLANRGAYLQSVDTIVSIIRQYPASYLLLQQIYQNRAQYTKEDLDLFLSHFETPLRESTYAYNLNVYLEHCPDDYNPLYAIPLLGEKADYVGGYDRRKPLNMLVFSMAPVGHSSSLFFFYLPQQLDSFASPNLHIVEISLLGIKRIWEDYIETNSPWERLYLPRDRRELIYSKYNLHDLSNINDLPYVVFTDDSGTILGRFNGFARETTIGRYQAFIENYLTSTDSLTN